MEDSRVLRSSLANLTKEWNNLRFPAFSWATMSLAKASCSSTVLFFPAVVRDLLLASLFAMARASATARSGVLLSPPVVEAAVLLEDAGCMG